MRNPGLFGTLRGCIRNESKVILYFEKGGDWIGGVGPQLPTSESKKIL